MRFNAMTYFATISLIATSLLFEGCGLMGAKDDLKKIIEYKSSAEGCLNNFGPNMEKFIDGEVDQKSWDETWECTVNSLELFEQFVKGSAQDGYTEEDIHTLISKFLVTNKTISKDLIKSSFALKASLFGGDEHVLSRNELKKFIKLMRIGQTKSLALLPHLKNRSRNPSGEQLIALNTAIEEFGVHVGDALVGNGNFAFTKSNAKVLQDELVKLYGWKIEEDYISFGFVVKQILVGGNSDRIEGDVWPKIFHILGTLGGGIVASISANKENMHGPNEYGNFIFNLGTKAKTIMDNAVDSNGGVIKYSKMKDLIDVMPRKWIVSGYDNDDQTYADNKDGYKQFLRPIIKSILWSQAIDGLDKYALNMAFQLASKWNRGQGHLEKIYQKYDIDQNGMSWQDFNISALQYMKNLDSLGKEDVTRLINIAKKYVPLFEAKDPEMNFNTMTRHSLGNLSNFHWMNLAARHLIESYGTIAKKTKVSTDDALKVLDDFAPPMTKLKMLDPTVKDLHIKRLREIDMFMMASNGDTYGDEDEATYYLAVMLSAGHLSERIKRDVQDLCRLPEGKKDKLNWYWMDSTCWKDHVFKNYPIYWDHFDQFKQYYETMISESDKKLIQTSMMKAARRYGDVDDPKKNPFGGLDNVSFAAVIHYIEMLFLRYDESPHDQALNKKEAMNAYPNFKGIIGAMLPKYADNDALMSAGFTFMVKFGEIPNANPTSAKEIMTIAKFGWWMLWPNQWYIHATRVNVYNVIPVLAGSDTPPPNDGQM